MKNEQEICRMKAITVFVLVLAIFLVFSSCGQQEKDVQKGEEKQEIAIDIVKLMEEAEHYEETYYDSIENASYFIDFEKFITYFKVGSTKLANDIPSFLDSIGAHSCIPLNMPDPPENEMEILQKAIWELGRYQKRERRFYPEVEVKEALDCMSHGLWVISTHGSEASFVGGLYYWFNFATQAALLCPNLEFISKVHSPDHQVGLYGVGTSDDMYGPVMTCMITPQGNHCMIRIIDIDVALEKVFQIEDEFGKEYYLFASSGKRLKSVEEPAAYLYDKTKEGLVCSAKSALLYSAIFDGFYETIPIGTDEDGNTMFKVVYSDFTIKQSNMYNLSPSSFIDSLRIIYNPKKYQWDLCIRNGEEFWHKIEGTKSMYLHLDEKVPYFEIH